MTIVNKKAKMSRHTLGDIHYYVPGSSDTEIKSGRDEDLHGCRAMLKIKNCTHNNNRQNHLSTYLHPGIYMFSSLSNQKALVQRSLSAGDEYYKLRIVYVISFFL